MWRALCACGRHGLTGRLSSSFATEIVEDKLKIAAEKSRVSFRDRSGNRDHPHALHGGGR